MSLITTFRALPPAPSAVDFTAFPLPGGRTDFLAKASDGGPVFLLQDSSPTIYSPAIELKYVSVQFHSTCRVTTGGGAIENQFAVVSCDASVPELHEVFIRCLAAAVEQLPVVAGTSDLQHCVRSLLDLFRALSRPSSREVTGLWAELFIIAKSKNVAQALRAWHADQFERFDFSWPSGCLEVKATANELRQHEFALEQLQSPLGGSGYVASVLLQAQGGGVGVIDLGNEIEASVATEPGLRQKLWENVAASLGDDFSERLDRTFDASYAARNLAVYAMGDIPALQQPSDPRITAVRFRTDLSTVTSSLAGSARSVLDTLFM
ncbi:PD-(D/E)XK motif protein [Paraburkholderia acidiphila]|uniref:PD-(D/E)XK motif protein n=1 Tax=Paraburkholderia acidiphila TaxID=2571747 RepID=A0A7Z2G1W0_9BURK|nr:PD-(D/E)XK motif protein [Paraburkholderia acidiphila]QGZ53534.1 PD-(D/E)XK motif protein [Paraburkholderia acidiphila]